MGKTDKRLFALATALILIAISWFAQFSRAQPSVTISDSIVQIVDATMTGHAEIVNPHTE